VEVAVGGGTGEVACQPMHPREAVLWQAGEGRLGECAAGIGLQARRLEGGEPQGEGEQDTERLDRPLDLSSKVAAQPR
jgi:hypothetical protein